MAPIGATRAKELIEDAAEVGITPEMIAERLRLFNADCIDGISGNDLRKIGDWINETRLRQQVVAECLRYAKLLGHDETMRDKIKDLGIGRLRKLAYDARSYLQRQGVDTRTEEEKEAARRAPATPRQVEYLVTLLKARRASGEGGGFAAVNDLYTNGGRPDRQALKRLSKTEASNLIDSLKGNY